MALIDDKNFTQVTDNQWVQLLQGEGIITNMGGLKQDIKFRFDNNIPNAQDAHRLLLGTESDNENSFVNEDSNSSVYGKSRFGKVNILVTRNVI